MNAEQEMRAEKRIDCRSCNDGRLDGGFILVEPTGTGYLIWSAVTWPEMEKQQWLY